MFDRFSGVGGVLGKGWRRIRGGLEVRESSFLVTSNLENSFDDMFSMVGRKLENCGA